MLHLTDFPLDLRNFPRDDYTDADYRHRRLPDSDTDVLLAAGARRATRAWHTAVRTGRWEMVDTRCFILTVLDKVVQMYVQRLVRADRRNAYARMQIEDPWPLRTRLDEWRDMLDELIGIAYCLALDSLAANMKECLGTSTPPALEVVRVPVRQAMEWFREYGDALELCRTPMPVMDLEVFLGPFAVKRRKPVHEATRRLAGLSIRDSTRDVRSSDSPNQAPAPPATSWDTPTAPACL